jgi:hypothetical protein
MPDDMTQFVICESCFWCASILGGSRVGRCPCCNSSTLESIPIAADESYTFDYTAKRGVMLDFAQVD